MRLEIGAICAHFPTRLATGTQVRQTARQKIIAILTLMVILLGLSACGQIPTLADTQVIKYSVKPGDTLYSISWRYGYDHRQVAAWNRIPEPYTIRVGQVIHIIPPRQQQRTRTEQPPAKRPETTTSTAPRDTPTRPVPSQPAPSASSPAAKTPPPARPVVTAPAPSPQNPIAKPAPSPKPAPTPTPTPTPRPTAAVQQSPPVWQWPAQGQRKYSFNVNAGKKGIGISGTLGQSIHAAADGEVVYSGSGLIGYGNLLIIKHDDVYLSAYGHNRRLLVQEGTKVKRGQKIAEMGESSRDGIVLHFEIRKDGNPVNPIGYLPKSGS